MPSPLAHMATGYLIGQVHQRRSRFAEATRTARRSLVLGIVPIVISVLPDLDTVLGLLLRDFGRFHNNWTHSLIVGLAVASLLGITASWMSGSEFPTWFVVGLAAYEMHVIMDYFTIGRGVMLFWPFAPERYSSPVKLFYGLHWSDGWLSLRHVWTLLTELGFVVVITAVVHLLTTGTAKPSSIQEPT